MILHHANLDAPPLKLLVCVVRRSTLRIADHQHQGGLVLVAWLGCVCRYIRYADANGGGLSIGQVRHGGIGAVIDMVMVDAKCEEGGDGFGEWETFFGVDVCQC